MGKSFSDAAAIAGRMPATMPEPVNPDVRRIMQSFQNGDMTLTEALAAVDRLKEQKWELRSSRRCGSQHVAFFWSELEARGAAEDRIRDTGNVGRIEQVTLAPNVVYFTEYRDDD